MSAPSFAVRARERSPVIKSVMQAEKVGSSCVLPILWNEPALILSSNGLAHKSLKNDLPGCEDSLFLLLLYCSACHC